MSSDVIAIATIAIDLNDQHCLHPHTNNKQLMNEYCNIMVFMRRASSAGGLIADYYLYCTTGWPRDMHVWSRLVSPINAHQDSSLKEILVAKLRLRS